MKRFKTLLILLISIITAQAQFADYDAVLKRLSIPSFCSLNGVSIAGEITNNGMEVLNTLNVNYQVDEEDIVTTSLSGMDLPKGFSESFKLNEPLRFSEGKNIVLKVWLSMPNNQVDEKPENDTLSMEIEVIDQFPEKNFLIEEVTGAWCGYCPRAPIIYEKIVKPNYPNTILACIHSGDNMTHSSTSSVQNAYVSGVPCGFVNRTAIGDYDIDMSPEDWKPAIGMMDQEITPAEINVYNYFYPDTYEWKIDVVVDFIVDYSGSMRLNCYVLEDSLTGRGQGWDQANYFNNSAQEPYMELVGAGNPITNYYHNHVVRTMLGGSWGKSGIIPSSVKKGDRFVYSNTFKIGADWDPRQLHAVGILQRYNRNNNRDRQILNAKKVELSLATGYSQADLSTDLNIYPNPTKDDVFIKLSGKNESPMKITVHNSLGQEIFSKKVTGFTGEQLYRIHCREWNPGLYFVKIIQGQTIQKGKILRIL